MATTSNEHRAADDDLHYRVTVHAADARAGNNLVFAASVDDARAWISGRLDSCTDPAAEAVIEHGSWDAVRWYDDDRGWIDDTMFQPEPDVLIARRVQPGLRLYRHSGPAMPDYLYKARVKGYSRDDEGDTLITEHGERHFTTAAAAKAWAADKMNQANGNGDTAAGWIENGYWLSGDDPGHGHGLMPGEMEWVQHHELIGELRHDGAITWTEVQL